MFPYTVICTEDLCLPPQVNGSDVTNVPQHVFLNMLRAADRVAKIQIRKVPVPKVCSSISYLAPKHASHKVSRKFEHILPQATVKTISYVLCFFSMYKSTFFSEENLKIIVY